MTFLSHFVRKMFKDEKHIVKKEDSVVANKMGAPNYHNDAAARKAYFSAFVNPASYLGQSRIGYLERVPFLSPSPRLDGESGLERLSRHLERRTSPQFLYRDPIYRLPEENFSTREYSQLP